MSDSITIAETAKKIIADLTSEKEQIAASIDNMEGKLDGMRSKMSDIDSAISILIETYKIKTRPTELDASKAAPLTRGRKKNIDPKKKKPIEIKTAVRDFIAVNLDFPVKALVAAVRAVRPDAQQPSIQAELTKLMKSGELARVGYGQYRSNVYSADSNAEVSTDKNDSADTEEETAE